MVFAVVVCPGGKSSTIVAKITQVTATVPTGDDQRPRLNDPGFNLSRPDVMRSRMGTV